MQQELREGNVSNQELLQMEQRVTKDLSDKEADVMELCLRSWKTLESNQNHVMVLVGMDLPRSSSAMDIFNSTRLFQAPPSLTLNISRE